MIQTNRCLSNPISCFCFGQRHEERVIIISSKDNDEKVTDAEKALEQIAHLILKVRWSSHTFCNIHN